MKLERESYNPVEQKRKRKVHDGSTDVPGLDTRARRWITLAVALMTLAAVALIAQALLLSQTISRASVAARRLALSRHCSSCCFC